MRIVLAIALSIIALPASAGSVAMGSGHGAIDALRDIDALGLGHRFCEARLLDDMSRVEGYLAPRLTRLLVRVAPDEVPWQSGEIRPTGCLVEVVNNIDNTAGVLLRLQYSAPGMQWEDTLGLLRTPDSWRITNVFYEGGGNLRFRLFESGN